MFNPDLSYRSPPGSPHFCTISVRKLVLLTVASFGFYQIAWHYRNWWAIRLRTGARLSPIWRSLWFWLFAFALFRRMRQSADEQGVETMFSPPLAAAVYALLALFWRLDQAFWFTTMLTIVPLVFAQRLANRVNAVVAPHAALDEHLTKWQRVTVPLGSVSFVLAVVGTAEVAF